MPWTPLDTPGHPWTPLDTPGHPWTPLGTPSVRFFIHQIVLGEESDEGLPDADGIPTYASHCDAMREVDGDAVMAKEATDAACAAVEARLAFWDGVQAAIARR